MLVWVVVVSVVLIVEVPVVSVLIVPEPVVVEDVSVVTEVESVVEVDSPFPHAAKAPRTKTNNSFFIFLCLIILRIWLLIHTSIKGNPAVEEKIQDFFLEEELTGNQSQIN